MSIERNVMVSHSEIDSLDTALTWVVQQVDREFSCATMVKISIEQFTRMDEGESEWRPVWTAAVSGLTEERQR